MKTPEELENYLQDVEDALGKLRSKALGQDLSYDILLPPKSEHWTAEEKAAYLTKRFLFALSKAEPVVSILPELEESRDWLYALVLFLEEKCSPPDHTFFAMKKIIELDEETRATLFGEAPYIALQADPPFLLGNFDLSILYLLYERTPDLKSEIYLQKIVNFL